MSGGRVDGPADEGVCVGLDSAANVSTCVERFL